MLFHFAPDGGRWSRVGAGLVLVPLPEDLRAAPVAWAVDAESLVVRMRMAKQDGVCLVDAAMSRFNLELSNPGESRPFCVVEDLDELVAESDSRAGGTRPLFMETAPKAFALRRPGGVELALYVMHTAHPDGDAMLGTLVRASLREGGHEAS